MSGDKIIRGLKEALEHEAMTPEQASDEALRKLIDKLRNPMWTRNSNGILLDQYDVRSSMYKAADYLEEYATLRAQLAQSQEALREAVKAEREACAVEAENWLPHGTRIASAIRSRSEQGEKP